MTNIFRIPYSLIRPLYEKTNFHKAVITEVDDTKLRAAYSHCRSITRIHAKTFYMATRFLPYKKQRSIFAMYGWCRCLDDLVDEAEDLMHDKKINEQEIFGRLEHFSKKLVNTYRGEEQNDPILIAFSNTLNMYDISIEMPLLLIEGVKMDLTKNRYNNFEELYDYSYKVASVVGLMTSKVFGYEDESALEYAEALGIAMQLTNILRDVGEDLDRGRVYLPENELRSFNISIDELKNRELSDKFIEFMKFQISRARDYYEKADIGIEMLSKDSRLPVMLARENYSRILDKIEENNYNVFDKRAYLNSTEKLTILPRVMYNLRMQE